jgi:hypothetical protein
LHIQKFFACIHCKMIFGLAQKVCTSMVDYTLSLWGTTFFWTRNDILLRIKLIQQLKQGLPTGNGLSLVSTEKIKIQWGYEYRTNPDFEWSILPRTRHLITRPFKNWTIRPVFEWSTSLDRFINKTVIKRKYLIIKWSSLVEF